MIFHHNGSISCLYLIWLSVLNIYDVTLTAVIVIELHHFMSWFYPVIYIWILYVMSWFNPVVCYIHIIIRFCHSQFCTNDFPMCFYEIGIYSCFLTSFDSINIWIRAPWCLSSRWWVLSHLWGLIFRFHHLSDAR